MGLEKLISSLKKNEQKQIDDIWQQARAEADSLRKQIAEEIDKISEEHAGQLASACQKSARGIFAEAETESRKRKLFSYQYLDEALHAAAMKQLSKLREVHYENVFAQLVKELPDGQWEKILVNPSDTNLAAKLFNKNIVQPDKAIIAGLVAVNADCKIVVDNTFEKRLERKWPYILPGLIKKIEEKYGEPLSAEKTG